MTVIQFGLLRSGSTLIYNILRELKFEVVKSHSINPILVNQHEYAVCTYRHPYDSICSLTQFTDREFNNHNIRRSIEEYKQHGGNELFRHFDYLKESNKVLLLRYEDFVNNYNYLFDKLEEFFKIKIENRSYLQDKYLIKNVKRMISHLKNYTVYDTVNLWHGNHISSDMGAIDRYQLHFNKEHISLLKPYFDKFLEKFDYTIH